jgi:IMP dehydrogenase
VTYGERASRADALALLHKHRLERVLVVDKQWQPEGPGNRQGHHQGTEHPNACKDAQGKLRVGAAVASARARTSGGTAGRCRRGACWSSDTAHGHAKGVLDRVKWVKKKYPGLQVIGGNVGTGDGALALVDHGADAVKVGIGPGRSAPRASWPEWACRRSRRS